MNKYICNKDKPTDKVNVETELTVPVLMTEQELYDYMFTEAYLTSNRFKKRFDVDIHNLSIELRLKLLAEFSSSFISNPFDTGEQLF